jgi:folate-binding protein YgfZ
MVIKRRHYSVNCNRRAGAPKIEAENLSHFYTPLEQEALLHISGPDAQTFLQGQVTCDVHQVTADHSLPGAYCTPQGRVVCDFLLCQLQEQHLVLRLRRDLRATAAGVFGKYIIFSKAELDSENDDWQLFGCWGSGVAPALQGIFGSIPGAGYASAGGDGFLVVQTDSLGERFECYVHKSRLPSILEGLESTLQLAGEADWQVLDIDAGIARLQAATSSEFVPQMLNFDLTGHISFNKGCYTGQEVVARLHYRGTPKRRLYRAGLPTGAPAQPGDALYGSNGEQSVGNLVNVVHSANDTAAALLVATVATVDEGLHLQAPGGPALELGELPYSLEPG